MSPTTIGPAAIPYHISCGEASTGIARSKEELRLIVSGGGENQLRGH